MSVLWIDMIYKYMSIFALENLGCKGLKYKSVLARNVDKVFFIHHYFDGLVQGCSNSSALAMELLQSCIKPSINFIFISFSAVCLTNDTKLDKIHNQMDLFS